MDLDFLKYKNNKYLLILFIILVIADIILACYLFYDSVPLDSTDSSDNTGGDNISTSVSSTSTECDTYDPYGYGNDVYHYDSYTDTYITDDDAFHYIYDYMSDKWINVDIPGQYENGTQQGINDYIETVEE